MSNELDIRGLILRHRDRRRLTEPDPNKRLANWLELDSNLREGLDHLTDVQLARIISEYVQANIDNTSSVILTSAEDRLKRAQGGPMKDTDIEEALTEGPPCPKCGSEMEFYPALPPENRSYYQCSSTPCEERLYL